MVSSSSLDRFLETATEYLIDSRTGIIRSVTEMPKTAGAPLFFHFAAQSARTQFRDFVYSGGASIDRKSALAKAIGEVIERYCAGLYDPEQLPLCSFRRAQFPCVDPDDFALYSAQQYSQEGFPFVKFDKDAILRWAQATDLMTGRICYVPAGKVFLPSRQRRVAGERPLMQTISTGLASHSTSSEAIMNATYEVIERDAFTIMWQTRSTMPHVQINSLSDQNRDLIERFERAGNQVYVLDITLDHGIPTILTVIHNASLDSPALAFAAATELDAELAVKKSLEELELTRSFAYWIKTTRFKLGPDPTYSNVKTREDHVNLYCDHANSALVEFVFASKETRDFLEIQNLSTGDPERDLSILIEKVRMLGQRILVADLTSPEISELGITVVRAIIPGFHPLVFGHRIRALGGTRLWEVPQKLGYRGITCENGDNPVPHPFP